MRPDLEEQTASTGSMMFGLTIPGPTSGPSRTVLDSSRKRGKDMPQLLLAMSCTYLVAAPMRV